MGEIIIILFLILLRRWWAEHGPLHLCCNNNCDWSVAAPVMIINNNQGRIAGIDPLLALRAVLGELTAKRSDTLVTINNNNRFTAWCYRCLRLNDPSSSQDEPFMVAICLLLPAPQHRLPPNKYDYFPHRVLWQHWAMTWSITITVG